MDASFEVRGVRLSVSPRTPPGPLPRVTAPGEVAARRSPLAAQPHEGGGALPHEPAHAVAAAAAAAAPRPPAPGPPPPPPLPAALVIEAAAAADAQLLRLAKCEVDELLSFMRPPACIEVLSHALCILFGVPAALAQDPSAPGKKVKSWFRACLFTQPQCLLPC